MGKLLKYELRKSWLTKLVVLGLAAVAELVFAYGLEFHNEDALALGIMFLVFIAIGGVMLSPLMPWSLATGLPSASIHR